jgi:hypothetical protein
LWGIVKFDFGILRSFQGSHEVETGKVSIDKMCTWCGYDAIEEDFDEEKVTRGEYQHNWDR